MKAFRLLLVLCLGCLITYAAEKAPMQEIEVTLISDGVTWVSITKVSMPAQFRSKVVKLPPGKYEVIGRRKNFPNVVQTLTVQAGVSPEKLTVICK